MAYSVRSGKLGFECDVCGVFVGEIRLLKSCYYCHKVICPLHARWALKPASLRPQFRFSRLEDKFCDVCPECDEERQREELEKEEEERQRQEELEEEEAERVIPRCQICGAHEVHGEGKTFPSPPLIFTNCERCGKLVCDFCSRSSTDMMHGYFHEALGKYDIICKDCYDGLEREYAARWDEEFGETSEGPNPYRHEQKREDYWPEEEQSKIED